MRDCQLPVEFNDLVVIRAELRDFALHDFDLAREVIQLQSQQFQFLLTLAQLHLGALHQSFVPVELLGDQ
jgi:hypothetical protein